MKKLFLTTAISSLLASSSALAITQPGSFYIGAEIGGGLFSEIDGVYNSKVTTVTAEANKAKYEAEKAFFGAIEVGYNISEQIRVGIMGKYYLEPEFKYTPSEAKKKEQNEVTAKYSAMIGLAKVSFDLYRAEAMRLSVVGGAGVNYMSGKYDRAARAGVTTGEGDDEAVTLNAVTASNIETPSNFYLVWQAGAEAAYEVQPGMYVKVGGGYTHLNAMEITAGKVEDTDKDKKVLLREDEKLSGPYAVIGFSIDL